MAGPDGFNPASITRPDPALLRYYLVSSLLTVVGLPFALPPLVLRYLSLRYRFDDKGVSMSWGVLFHREVYLTYRRIQDIHVTRGLVQRWFDLATVSVQTASGTAGAEMNIEGIREPEKLRDFLYAQMRGARDEAEVPSAAAAVPLPADDPLTLLREIRDELRRLRETRGGS